MGKGRERERQGGEGGGCKDTRGWGKEGEGERESRKGGEGIVREGGER